MASARSRLSTAPVYISPNITHYTMEGQTAPAPPNSGRGRGRGSRGGFRRRGGPRRPRQNAQDSADSHISHPSASAVANPALPNPSLGLRPASVTPAPSEAGENAAGNRGSRRRGRGGRGAANRGQMHGAGGRTFGGHLTSTATNSPSTQLHADAPAFHPGQAVAQSAVLRFAPKPKSVALDLPTRLHEDIANRVYECSICTDEIGRRSRVWSCQTCYTVFHLGCIKKWSTNEGSTQQRQQQPQNGDLPPLRQWRCPGCNLPKDGLPTNYACWCGSEVDPKPVGGLPPHSCGSSCSKRRAGCPHPCSQMCHAGPCPPCFAMGPTQLCFCGKETSTKRCTETKYDEGFSCGNICNELLPCGEHYCSRPCHDGMCGHCEVLMDCRCYCGKTEKQLFCYNREDSKESEAYVADVADPADKESMPGDKFVKIDHWTGSFNCHSTCAKPYDCGKHMCEKGCHAQSLKSSHCPRSPDVVATCPCGQTSLDELLEQPRKSCEDKIPHCSKKCLRPLPGCGHPCQLACHVGSCSPCMAKISITCRCGRTTSSSLCHQGFEERPQCMRTCKITLNCGRHECGEHCCPGEKPALERQAARRKLRREHPEPEFEAEHICTRVCDKQLKCGNEDHKCPELCHRGPCGSCREAIFEEISCNCGRTILQPPLPCGTQPPPCQYACTRPRDCGHPQVSHNCHGDSETCPKCPFLLEKTCMCGKKTLKNQPCWFNDVSCGLPCGALLKCGSHRCQRSCHRGPCESPQAPCKQLCGKILSSCGHPDITSLCHSPYPCKEDKPCQAKIIITCDCQHKKQETRCLSTKTDKGNNAKTLPCDEECLRLQRNQKLAAALNIDPATHQDDHIPYSQTTLDLFKNSPKWCQTQEREFRVFASDDTEKRLRFKPMQASQRAFLHALAEDFGLDSESMDPEPHRHVSIFKTPRFVSAPMKTLAQCVKTRQPSPEPAKTKGTTHNADPWNAFVLTSPRFGLTIDELRNEIQSELATLPRITPEISFLPSEEIVIHTIANNTPASEIDAAFKALKPVLAKTIKAKELAEELMLCHVDSSLNILRRDWSLTSAEAGGWSQVAKGGSGMRKVMADRIVGKSNSFTVLGTKKALGGETKAMKKENVAKKVEEDVADDWEAAVDGWE